MQAKIYDVFCHEHHAGNPCGVVLLPAWLADSELLKMSQDIGQPVTSFVIHSNDQYHIRWFSLTEEINLCGHGSLGAGAAILQAQQLHEVTLHSKYGQIQVVARNDRYQIKLPSWRAEQLDLQVADFIQQLGLQPLTVLGTRDLIVVLPSETDVGNFQPVVALLEQMPNYHALILTAQSGNDGYVLRYFAPKIGIPEDLATGSAHCSLAPYWFSQLQTKQLTARQLSKSGGYFQVVDHTDDTFWLIAQARARTPHTRT